VSTWLVLLWGCGPKTTPEAQEPVVVERSVEQVTIPSGPLSLEGTLITPEHAEGETVPAVVLVHGSGPNSRDQPVGGQVNMAFGFEIEVLGQLARELADRGVAVLRYDKRTCFSANGCDNDYPSPSDDIVIDDFVDDAAAAIRFVAEQPLVDPDRVSVVGHSQGGTFVPVLLRDVDVLDGGVILAGPFRGIDALLRHQLELTRDLLAKSGLSPAQIDLQVAALTSTVEDVESIAAGTFEGDAVSGASTAFWQSWLDLSAEARTAALDVHEPMLALGGGYDWNVPPEEIEAWGAHLAGSDIGHQATVLPCVTHALNCVSQPDWQRIEPADIGRDIDVSVIEAIAHAVR